MTVLLRCCGDILFRSYSTNAPTQYYRTLSGGSGKPHAGPDVCYLPMKGHKAVELGRPGAISPSVEQRHGAKGERPQALRTWATS